MKVVFACIIIAALLVVGYYVRPGIKTSVADYWDGRVEAITLDSRLTVAQRYDSLVVLSLDFRTARSMDLAWRALTAADSLLPDQPLTKGMIGLFHLEAGCKKKAIQSWQRGAVIAPTDPNLSYLASLDTMDLASVDEHMLEKMFIDTIVNTKLKIPLYHNPDTEVIEQTEQNLRVQNSINTAFVGGSVLALIAIYFSVKQMKKGIKMTRQSVESKEETRGVIEKTPPMPKTVGYIVMISCVLKIGQILAAMYRYLKLGTDVSNFVSKYILIPENLWDIFSSNIVFAFIFIVIGAWFVFRKKVAGLV